MNSAKQGKPLTLPPLGKDDMATTATPPKDDENSIMNTSHAQLPSTEEKGKKKKFNYQDLFKDEGMFHSINQEFIAKKGRRGHGLIKTPNDAIERYEEE